MKLKLLFISLIALFSKTHAQCPSVVCPSDITVYSDSACNSFVNFTNPTGVDLCSTISSTFSFTGSEQTWVVPAGVYSITVNAYGAQGGSNWINNNNFGGHVQAELPVTPGTTLYIYVGGQPNSLTGGWNGGGNGESAGKGGGGASDIRIGGNSFSDRVIVSGGGGGAGYWNSLHVIGGVGGGLIGGNGSRVDFITSPGGEGGTQVASGNGTCVNFNNPICSGGFGFGGAPSGCGCEGYGGGGGGWYGGAGSGNCRGGGGGSSFTSITAQNVVHNQGVRIGNGEIVISYPNTVSLTSNQIAGISSGNSFPIGITTNTFEVISGIDTAWCSFDVIVLDTIAPYIIVPIDSIDVCIGDSVPNITPIAWDNCASPNVSYTITGATTGSGLNDASGTIFNSGVSTIWYHISDDSGNVDSTSITLTMHDLPVVSLNPFVDDFLCTNNSPVDLPSGTPSSGTYSGNGVSGSYFDPSQSGSGTHWIVYTFSDNNGCLNNDSIAITVNDAPIVSLEEMSPNTLCLNNNPVLLPSGTPSLGTYSGNGVSGNYFDPSQSGIGTHWIVYTYSDPNGCLNSDSVSVSVDACANLFSNSNTNLISIFPNPTKDIVTVNVGFKTNSIEYYLYATNGKMIFNGIHHGDLSFDIDLSKEEIGIYFLEVKMNDNSSFIKILKQ